MPTYVERSCLWCEKPFRVQVKEANRGKGTCCSVSCANAKRSADRKVPGARQMWIERVKDTEHYKLQRRAHHQVEQALIAGRLKKQGCEVCGSTERLHAHHEDYQRPLDVRWLCVSHHREHHG